jgi:hypothetical protein
MISKNPYLKATVGMIVIFCIGLVFFFIFSEPYGDGLEKTMENADVEEGEPSYNAPLDYGDNYITALVMGLIGFIIVLFCILLISKFMRKKDEARNN